MGQMSYIVIIMQGISQGASQRTRTWRATTCDVTANRKSLPLQAEPDGSIGRGFFIAS